jgi:glycosyltransferase involved in cell wall biosynthesis
MTTRRLRVTFAMYRPGLAGGTRVTAYYARALRARGHDVRVVCLGPPPKGRWGRFLEATGLGRQVPLAQQSPLLAQAGVPVRVVRGGAPRVSDFPDADVVLATFWPTAYWVEGLPSSKGAKAYFVQHHEIHAGEFRERAAATYRMPLHCITISSWLEGILRREYGARDVPVIHNAVDLEQFDAQERGKQAVPTVGFMYSTKPFKAAQDAIQAIEMVKRRVPELRVISFGSSAPTSAVRVPDYVEFTVTPPQELIPKLYAACDVWVCSSTVEGFGLPPLEAMACRTPAVSTRVGAMPELIVDGRNGFLVDVGDVDGLARRIEQIVLLPEADWRLASAAARETATGYQWEDATSLLEAELYRLAQLEPAVTEPLP